jgi:hypothetical protein
MGKKRTSGPSAAAIPAQGTKISFDDDNDDFDAPVLAKPTPKAQPVDDLDSDDDSDDEAPEAVGMGAGREAERERLAAAEE